MRQVTVGPETESEARFCTDMGSHSLKTESEARFCTGMGSHILKTKVRLGSVLAWDHTVLMSWV